MIGQARHLDDPEAIRRVYQRLCRAAAEVSLIAQGQEWPFPLLLETEGKVGLGLSAAQGAKLGLKANTHYLMNLLDRGNHYQGTVRLQGWGWEDSVECCYFEQPRELKAVGYDGLGDFMPEQPLLCTFSSPTQDICEGRIRALGPDGLELALWGSGAVKGGQLKVGVATTVDFHLDPAHKVVLASVTASMDKDSAGIRFDPKADPEALRAYRAWLRDAILGQEKRDQDGFELGGARAVRGLVPTLVRSISGVQLLSDRDPLVLVIGEGGFPARVAAALGRKFGIAGLDYVQGEVRPQLQTLGAQEAGWGRLKLILIHQRLRVASGLDLTRQLAQEEGCPVPILVAGTEADGVLKRNRAVACGAVDFIPVEPFHVLAVMRAVEETLRLFR